VTTCEGQSAIKHFGSPLRDGGGAEQVREKGWYERGLSDLEKL
jgi:hypothetical protein